MSAKWRGLSICIKLDSLKICMYKQDSVEFKVDPNMEKDLDCCMIGRLQADMNFYLLGKVESNFRDE